MRHLLTLDGLPLVDIEVFKDDLEVSIGIAAYTLLARRVEDPDGLTVDFEFIDQLRGWYHESWRVTHEPDFQVLNILVGELLRRAADKYTLDYGHT